MKKGNKLWYQNHKSRKWTKDFQNSALALSDAQVKELVRTELDLDSDELSDRSRLSMSARRSYGYSASFDRKCPDYGKVVQWLTSRVGQNFDKVSSEFVQFWKDSGMSNYDEGPITWMMKRFVDDREWTLDEIRKDRYGYGRYWKRFYLDGQDRLQRYPAAYRSPRYGAYKKESDQVQATLEDNKNIYETFKYKISGDGPVPIGYYYLDANNRQFQTQVFAVNLRIWNQDLPEEKQTWPPDVRDVRWWPNDRRDLDFLHFLHTNYTPVTIPGVGSYQTGLTGSSYLDVCNYWLFVKKI